MKLSKFPLQKTKCTKLLEYTQVGVSWPVTQNDG